jgi:hypothetical protein
MYSIVKAYYKLKKDSALTTQNVPREEINEIVAISIFKFDKETL